MASQKIIDWDKPLRLTNESTSGRSGEFGRVSVFDSTDDHNKIIQYHYRDGGGPYYTVVDDASGISFEPRGYHVENIPGEAVKEPEEPANCVALIKYADNCHDASCRGKWFVCPGQQGKDGDITPMCRSELESFVKGCEPYVIVELPS